MAVAIISPPQGRTNYVGLSTDTKPTSGVPPGSTFFEEDTQKTSVFGADGNWYLYTIAVALYDVSGGSITAASGNLNTNLWIWQPSTLAYIQANADSSGQLNVSGSGGGGGGEVTQGTVPWAVAPDGTEWTLNGTSANVNVTNLPSTQPVSGTVTADQGGAPWTVKPDGTAWAMTGTSANVNVTNGSSGGNSAASATGDAVPADADYVGFNSGGDLVGVSSSNPLPVDIISGGGGSNAAASATGSAVPSDAGYTGWDSGGDLVGVSLTDALPVQPGTGATFPVSGTITADQGGSWSVSISGTPSVDVSNFPSTQNVNLTEVDGTSLGAPTSYGTAPSGDVLGVNAYITNTPAVSISGTPTVDIASGQTIVVTQATASNLNATVTGTVTAEIEGHGGATLDGVITAATAPANGLASLNVYQTTIPALTAGQSVATQCDTTGALFVRTDTRQATYRATSGSITPVAAATDPLMTLIGSSTKTIRVTRVYVNCAATTGIALPATVTIERLSALSGGTAVTHTALPLDSNNASATAVMSTYTTVPTSVTAVAAAESQFMNWTTESATVGEVMIGECEFEFGTKGGSQFVLRGTSQWLALLCSTVGTTPVMCITVEWIEDNS